MPTLWRAADGDVSTFSWTRIVALVLLVAVLLWLALIPWLQTNGAAAMPTLPRQLGQQISGAANHLPWWIGLVVVALFACLVLASRRHE
jgi:hypothetical protein